MIRRSHGMDDRMRGERLRILHAWADPPSVLATGTAVESGSLCISLQTLSDRVDYRTQPACSRSDLLRRLDHFRPHVLHLGGHGAPDGSILLMHPDTGTASPLGKRDLAALLRGRVELRLLVLTCCHGLARVEELEDAVPAVVAVKDELHEPYPIVFAAALYHSLAHGRALEHAVEGAVVDADERLAPGGTRFELWMGSPVGKVPRSRREPPGRRGSGNPSPRVLQYVSETLRGGAR